MKHCLWECLGSCKSLDSWLLSCHMASCTVMLLHHRVDTQSRPFFTKVRFRYRVRIPVLLLNTNKYFRNISFLKGLHSCSTCRCFPTGANQRTKRVLRLSMHSTTLRKLRKDRFRKTFIPNVNDWKTSRSSVTDA